MFLRYIFIKKLSQFVHRIFLHTGQQVGVRVESKPDQAVAQALGDDLDVQARPQQEAGYNEPNRRPSVFG